jgi:hypothetical protein
MHEFLDLIYEKTSLIKAGYSADVQTGLTKEMPKIGNNLYVRMS